MSQVQLACLLTKKTETSELKGEVHYEHNPPIIAALPAHPFCTMSLGRKGFSRQKDPTRLDDSFLFLSGRKK